MRRQRAPRSLRVCCHGFVILIRIDNRRARFSAETPALRFVAFEEGGGRLTGAKACPQSSGPLCSSFGCAADEDRRRLLNRAWRHRAETPFELECTFLENSHDENHAIFESRYAGGHRNAEHVELSGHVTEPKHRLRTTTCQHIKRREFLSDFDRIV